MSNRNYYIQRFKTDDDETPDVVDIEATFDNLYINDIEGILHKGTIKNRYTETFADRAEAKVWNPPSSQGVLRSETTVKIVLTTLQPNGTVTNLNDFVQSYIDFIEYIEDRQFYLWDNMRNAKVELVLVSAISPDDILTLGQERIEVSVECANLKGDFVRTTD